MFQVSVPNHSMGRRTLLSRPSHLNPFNESFPTRPSILNNGKSQSGFMFESYLARAGTASFRFAKKKKRFPASPYNTKQLNFDRPFRNFVSSVGIQASSFSFAGWGCFAEWEKVTPAAVCVNWNHIVLEYKLSKLNFIFTSRNRGPRVNLASKMLLWPRLIKTTIRRLWLQYAQILRAPGWEINKCKVTLVYRDNMHGVSNEHNSADIWQSAVRLSSALDDNYRLCNKRRCKVWWSVAIIDEFLWNSSNGVTFGGASSAVLSFH